MWIKFELNRTYGFGVMQILKTEELKELCGEKTKNLNTHIRKQ